MNMPLLSVTWLGRISQDLLANPCQAVITGITSRGIFIRLKTDWIVFLSYERFRGPLTLNLLDRVPELEGIGVGHTVNINRGRIQIPSIDKEIDFSQARIWEAEIPPDPPLIPGERIRSLEMVAKFVLSQKKEPGFYLVLKDLLGVSIGGLPSLPGHFERLDCLYLLNLLKTADLEAVLSALIPFLGVGAGLTPSGDDVILGLLLAYQRWSAELRPPFELEELEDRLRRMAAQKTTLLSVNLIACASQGQADERLISALDGLLTGDPAPDQCARYLSSWGNTSGSDALVGMALAILSALP